ncbi:MAG TPA: NAD(P)-dependent oxidoreductase [Cyclobacteriaceae bacterium]|nr:NAD(P)-dependent oxidoreductase [Cyclobacteriaceae bacterium]
MKKKCLIIDRMHESLFPMLEETGWEFDYRPELSRSEIKKVHHAYTGMIVRSKTQINQDLLGDSPALKFVGRAGAGLDNLDLDYLSQKKIHVLHAGEGNRDAVGEHTVGILLSLLRNIAKADQEVRSFSWNREANRGTEIMDKTIGIIGYGNMGKAFAKRLSGFGCKVLAYDKYKTGYADSITEAATMDRIYQECDILSLHIPLTAETRKMVNGDYLSRFSKNIVLINTSRGEIVLQADLPALLESGKVLGAALDVLENEKLNELTSADRENLEKLFQQHNVIFTPHIAGWTFESHVKINVALINKIKSLNL